MLDETYFKETVVNNIKVKMGLLKSRLGMIKMYFEKPRIVFIHPDSDGERLFIFFDRSHVLIDYKRWKLGRHDPPQLKPLKVIRVRHLRSEEDYSITDGKGRTLVLIFSCAKHSGLYISFEKSGEEIEIENESPMNKYKVMYLG